MSGKPAAAGSHRLLIPGCHPHKLNELLKAHWAKAARLKRADREIVGWYARLAAIPKARAKRRVSLTIVLGPGQRAGDPDAYFKSLLDALVHAGLLVDDNRQHVELGPVTFARERTKATVILLEDLDNS